jgi:hypothetical protein
MTAVAELRTNIIEGLGFPADTSKLLFEKEIFNSEVAKEPGTIIASSFSSMGLLESPI